MKALLGEMRAADEPVLLGRRVGRAVAQWQRDLEEPGKGVCMVRSQGITFHFLERGAEGSQAVPPVRRELRVERATIFIEVGDPAEFAEVLEYLHLRPEEVGIVLHPTMFSTVVPEGNGEGGPK